MKIAKTARKPLPVVNPVRLTETTLEKCARLRLLQAKADRAKKLYKEIELLEWEIAQAANRPETFEASGKTWKVVVEDQFAVKNTVFKAAGVKRFVVKISEAVE